MPRGAVNKPLLPPTLQPALVWAGSQSLWRFRAGFLWNDQGNVCGRSSVCVVPGLAWFPAAEPGMSVRVKVILKVLPGKASGRASSGTEGRRDDQGAVFKQSFAAAL